jgi:hypothetical protein
MKTKFLLTFALAALLIFACGEDETAYTCKECVNIPEAIAANDGSGKGIYKGLVIGSSGTIKFNINNDGSYGAILELDGETYVLTTEGTFNSEGGFDAYFYGTMNETNDIQIGFYVSSSGTSFEVWIVSLPGHEDASISIYKEYSDALVAVYEGRFSGDASGVFNMLVRDTDWLVLAKDEDDDGYSGFFGSISNGTMNCTQCGDVEITGKVSGDVASGNWVGGDGGNGSWKGKRTL